MKKRIFAFMLVLGLLLAGCGGETVPETTENQNSHSNSKPMPEFDAQNKYLITYLASFQETEDFYCGNNSVDHFLRYYDKASGVSGVLCADPSCTHDSPSCGAYANWGTNLSIRGGKRYWVSQDPKESGKDEFLWCSELSGRNRERLNRIGFDEILDPYNPQSYVMHRGRLYLQGDARVVENGKGAHRVTLLSIPLDDSEEIAILADETVNAAFYDTARYIANDIYYSLVTSTADGTSDVTVTRINIDTGASEMVYEEKGLPAFAGRIWVTDAGEIYLPGSSETCAYLWKLENGKRKEVISWQTENSSIPAVTEGIAVQFSRKEKVIYVNIVDLSGNTVYSGKLFPEGIPELPGNADAYGRAVIGGDKDKLIMYLTSLENGKNLDCVVALDIHNNLKPTVLWSLEK